jgi:glutamate--cysteine ligase
MPTHDRDAAASHDEVVRLVAEVVRGQPTTGSGVGVELELLPVTRAAPTRRMRLREAIGPVPPIAEVVELARPDARARGSSLTVEPGGQVEIATSCCQRVPDAIDELSRTAGRLAARFDAAGAVLLAAGLDVWHDLETVPQQLRATRYQRMHAHLAARGGDGPLMMRHTCALQVNLDLGEGPVADARWDVANLLSPLAAATFAASPAVVGGRRVRSRRSLAWQVLDPTRTGFPPSLLEGRGEITDHVLEVALAADVLLVPPPDHVAADRASWSLADWLSGGHELGWPTEADVREHLTTLFPEVRARGFLELRAIDAVPAAFRRALMLLVAGAILDDVARGAILGLLEPHRATLPSLARRCATEGLSDPRLCALAVEVWAYARDGAARLPGVTRADGVAVEGYVDRFTVRGRAPADELAELLERDAALAMDWAAEPLPTTAEVPR